MAPGSDLRLAKLGTPGRGGKEKMNAAPRRAAASMLLLFDILDDLGHVVLVLAELGSIFEQLLVLLFGFFEGHRLLLFLLGGIRLLGFDLGLDLVGADRLELLLDRRRRAGAARPQECLGVKRRGAFRTDHRLAQQIIVARSATRTNPLGPPFGFGHHSLPPKFSKARRRGIAIGSLPCQKQSYESRLKEPSRAASRYGLWTA